MANKTTDNPPDAIPKRYRDQLVPACAVGVPEPIAEASEQLRVAGLAAEAAVARRREADEAKRTAPRIDQEAGVAAVKRGEDPPPPTAPEREREAVVARQAEVAAKAIAREAEVGLERTIRQHRDPWIAAQLEHNETLAGDALAAVDELGDALQALGESAGVVAALKRTPEGRGAIEHARMFKTKTIGFDAHDGTKSNPAPKVLDELRTMIAKALPEPPPSEAELAEREAFAESQRAWASLARGGVFVPGGG
jgi:hypothetical protein